MTTAEQLHDLRREKDFRPARFLMLLRRHFWLIGVSAGVVLAASVAYALFWPAVYEGDASLRIDKAKTELPNADFALETELNTEIEVLSSRSLVGELVDSLGLRFEIATPRTTTADAVLASLVVPAAADTASLELRLRPDSTVLVLRDGSVDTVGLGRVGHPLTLKGGITLTVAPAALAYKSITATVAARDDAIDEAIKRLKIDRPVRLGNLVTVAYRDRSAGQARDGANLLVRRFLAGRTSQGHGAARASVAFLQAQLDSLSTELRAAEDSLRRFRESRGVVDIGMEATTGVTQMAQLRAQRDDMAAERDALASLLAEVRATQVSAESLGPSPYRRLIAFPSLLKNDAASQILRSLAAVEDQRAELLIRRMPADSDVQTLTARIQELDDQLRSIAETYLQGLSNQVAAIDLNIAGMGRQLAEVPGKEFEAARLERRPKVLQDMYALLATRLKEAEIAQAAEEQDIRVVDAATLPLKPAWPRPLICVAGGLFLGLLVGLLAAFVREYFDKSVHTRYDVQALTGVPVLGLIPRFPKSRRHSRSHRDGKGLVVGVNRAAGVDLNDERNPRGMLVAGRKRLSGIAEAYGHLQTNLAFSKADHPPKVLMITSPLPGDGKTTSATNLALTLAQRGQRVLVIDADLRRGVINRAFSTSRSPGLTEVLTGKEPLEKAIWTVKTAQGHKLSFVPTGELPSHPAGLLGSNAMRELLTRLAATYDVILIDSAPVNSVTDTAVLAPLVDGVLVVARSGSTPLEALAFGIEQLRHVRAPLIGAILNDIDLRRDAAYDSVYRYYGHTEYAAAGPG